MRVGGLARGVRNGSPTLLPFKKGSFHLAIAAQVPIVPVVVWGAQQIWTKGLPKQLGRKKFRILIGVCDPLQPVGPAEELTERLKASMQSMLTQLQDLYGEHPQGAAWVPKRLGGSAPTLEEADALDTADVAERRRKRADGAGVAAD